MTEPTTKMLVDLVPYDAEVHGPFVASRWTDSYWRNSWNGVRMSRAIVYGAHRVVIARLMARGTRCVVATLRDDPSFFVGFFAWEDEPRGNVMFDWLRRPTIHYAYVRRSFRRFGVLRAMVEHAGIDPRGCLFTHFTESTTALMKRWPGSLYCPYAI